MTLSSIVLDYSDGLKRRSLKVEEGGRKSGERQEASQSQKAVPVGEEHRESCFWL